MSLVLAVLVGAWTSLAGPSGGNVRCVTANPDNPGTMLCCTWNGSHGGAFRSQDSGRTWQACSGIPRETGAGMNFVAFCPADTARAVCGTKILGQNGLFLSSDGGRSWHATGWTSGYVQHAFFHPGARDTLYAVSGIGLHRSSDAGATWETLIEQGNCWVAGFKPGSEDTMFLGSFDGLFRSTDQGHNWDACGFDRRCYDFTFDPDCPDTLYVGAHVYGVFKVWAGGEAWDSLGNGAHYNTTVAVDSARRDLYAGGFAFSPVPGRVSVGAGMGASWYEFPADRMFDPTCIDLCLAGGAAYAGSEYFGVQRFDRSDSVWHPRSEGIREANVRALWTGPDGALFCAGSMLGVSRSDDGGATWQRSLGTPVCGLAHNTEMLPPGLACSPFSSDTVYATFQGHAPPIQQVFRSTDGGGTWTGFRVPDLGPNDRLFTLAIHPTGPETLFLATAGGVYRSGDAGQTWSRRTPDLSYCVSVDPHHPATVYAGGIGAAWRSDDGGQNWSGFSDGLNALTEVMNIEPDPESAGVLVAALCGGEARVPQSGPFVYREQVGHWVQKTAGLPGSFRLRPRVAVDTAGDRFWCVLPNQGAQVYASTDRGETWLAADSGFTGYGAYYIHCGIGTWLGTRADGAWRWEPGTGLEESVRLGQPAGPVRFIIGDRLDLPGVVVVRDACGRRKAGPEHGGVDLGGLAPGVYFVEAGGRGFRAIRP